METIRRIFVEKKSPANTESISYFSDLKNNLDIRLLEGCRVVNCYDVSGITGEAFRECVASVFTEPPVDVYFEENLPIAEGEYVFGCKYLPGQYDQRADWAQSAIKLIIGEENNMSPLVNSSKYYVLKGSLSEEDINKVKAYTINPVDSMEVDLVLPQSLKAHVVEPSDVMIVEGFINMTQKDLPAFKEKFGLAMSNEDIFETVAYFRETEKRNPTITEIKVLDTYWSDHCRHTTFLTNIEHVEIEEGLFGKPIVDAYNDYLNMRNYVHESKKKSISLMDLAQMGMRYLNKKGLLTNLDESEEINACSIKVTAVVDGVDEDWLIMFKNETHNHPTEIEPFGGAATCLGGAIRDPLSGRAYVYQAMRVTGSGDPRVPIENTLAGKLPQRKITLGAASGYSAYGNQIGLSTGYVREIYDEGYVAKRMEIGAVIGAVKAENVVREQPADGDVIILLGGRTGRDGCGGATGSSKAHTDASIKEAGAEVQKGNPPTERKIQRLFRKPEVTKLIKRCNDFGAGGVSVAIGELADGLIIDLDKVPKKYEGLDGTELAISESQERMAVCLAPENANEFIRLSEEENLEAVVVAYVNNSRRLCMMWRTKKIVDISRDFLDTNGAAQFADVYMNCPQEPQSRKVTGADLKERWLSNLSDINICSQKGLVERFDSSIGAASVLMPFGGRYQFTQAEVMAAKLPVPEGKTNTATIMAYGFDPVVSKWSPFHGAMYAVVNSIGKVVAAGGSPHNIKLTFQEYFERLGNDKSKWGKPFASLLGALKAQIEMETASIGGKDSMSGTFKDLNVPPTLVSFAVCPEVSENIISAEFKKCGSLIVAVLCEYNEGGTPNFSKLNRLNEIVHEKILSREIISAHTIGYGGIAEALSKMAFGNRLGFKVCIDECRMFTHNYGGFVLELDCEENDFKQAFAGLEAIVLGHTDINTDFVVNGCKISHFEALRKWIEPLEGVFPTGLLEDTPAIDNTLKLYSNKNVILPKLGIAKPKVFIPVFPGTNCEYDTALAFIEAGAQCESFVVKSLNPGDLKEAGKVMAEKIKACQILAIPGGFSAADEPEGSGKFIAAMFRSEYVSNAIMSLLNEKDGLIIGICNGFQTLLKLGLLTSGKISPLTSESPTLTFNKIGRHISCIVNVKVISNKSPWMWGLEAGSVHRVAISHGEGRFLADENAVKILSKNGQIATQYVDFDGNAANCYEFNPNGSSYAIEGITSPDGRVFGKMGHSERYTENTFKNVPGNYEKGIFLSGVKYFS